MTCEYARNKIKKVIERNGISFGRDNDVEYVVDGYMKNKCGGYNGSAMTFLLEECHEEIVVLYAERMQCTREYTDQLETDAELGRAVKSYLKYDELYHNTADDFFEAISLDELLEAYRVDEIEEK